MTERGAAIVVRLTALRAAPTPEWQARARSLVSRLAMRREQVVLAVPVRSTADDDVCAIQAALSDLRDAIGARLHVVVVVPRRRGIASPARPRPLGEPWDFELAPGELERAAALAIEHGIDELVLCAPTRRAHVAIASNDAPAAARRTA
ncbi:hypothetical protein [Sandaracinus amylolyticus]|uniref:Uncharacterized protein n=1 Tax=Sandaracinus amylolyticus TaxID=927083 RepID=A0A0F6YGW9_9BACT|nr:hypothetical protein [Sandaracinus amylolyticus]AKF04388.1 hypothetical protein DB32_001537 [Sandaracinus amylolyticus]